MDRVSKLEKEVAVIDTRLSHVEEEIGTIRGDIKVLSSKMDKATGMILGGMALLQALSMMFGGS